MTIVVGYIPTPEGEAALAAGIRASKATGEPLHVVNSSRGDSLVDSRFATPEDLAALSAAIEAEGVVFEVEQQVRGRDRSDEIVEVALRVRATLIVIGLRRRTPTGKLITGSQAQRILLDAPCPVLSVKAAY
jgi:nucleotide-binding universal stress UspA family protein